ncbi:MAG TPA: hypothetical protein VFC19_34915 [Candidatus Limnocylindrales bacterium]|nr:hypothetical protein [Candidatus Limnocylindrales bacterium]
MNAAEEREYAEYITARLPALHRAAYLLTGRFRSHPPGSPPNKRFP